MGQVFSVTFWKGREVVHEMILSLYSGACCARFCVIRVLRVCVCRVLRECSRRVGKVLRTVLRAACIGTCVSYLFICALICLRACMFACVYVCRLYGCVGLFALMFATGIWCSHLRWYMLLHAGILCYVVGKFEE